MTVLDRDALDASPLADLHLLATELGVDGFRRLRKAELIDQILGRADGQDVAAEGLSGPLGDGEQPKPKPRSRSRAKPKPADAAADFLAVRAVLRGEAELPSEAMLAEGLRRI